MSPTTCSVAPWSTRCTGVIAITATIVAWLSASDRIAVTTPERSLGRSTATPVPRSTPSRAAMRSGSGRSDTAYTVAATICAASAKKNTPPRARMPKISPSASPGEMRFGPSTAPIVVAQTTIARSRPRRPGSERSVAAKRPLEVHRRAHPRSIMATRNSGNAPRDTATSPVIAPDAATRAPVARAGRRPPRRASRASGTAARAEPRVHIVAAVPLHAGDPERPEARSAPEERAAPIPMPASTWPEMIPACERRRMRATSASVSGVSAGAGRREPRRREARRWEPGAGRVGGLGHSAILRLSRRTRDRRADEREADAEHLEPGRALAQHEHGEHDRAERIQRVEHREHREVAEVEARDEQQIAAHEQRPGPEGERDGAAVADAGKGGPSGANPRHRERAEEQHPARRQVDEQRHEARLRRARVDRDDVAENPRPATRATSSARVDGRRFSASRDAARRIPATMTTTIEAAPSAPKRSPSAMPTTAGSTA